MENFKKGLVNCKAYVLMEKMNLAIQRSYIGATNNKRILGRTKRAPLSNNKIHHAGSRSVSKHRKRRKRDEAREPGVQNRVPGKALGCNFSRYIRDGSRNEMRKDPQVGRRKAREKSRSRISVHRGRRSCLMAERRGYSRGIFQLSKSLCRFLFLKGLCSKVW